MERGKIIMKNHNEILITICLIGCLICLFLRIIININELDITNLQKQEEWQKLEYYKTLNDIYN